MAPHDNDLSDSDDEVWSEVETLVLLGIPDGSVESITDITDAAVSRIGGHPAFLPSLEPPLSSSQCKVCSNPSELLVQLWCPFEDSPMDRALYVWGCARSSCQGKEGSVRAWRGLRRNDTYAAKLEKKRAKKMAEQAKARTTVEVDPQIKTAPKVNPFSSKIPSSPNTLSTLGIGVQIFGNTSVRPVTPTTSIPDVKNNIDYSDPENNSSDSEEDLLTAVTSLTIAQSPWKSAPSYPATYLSTISEYLSPQLKSKFPQRAKIIDPLRDDIGGKKDNSWATEVYEHSLGLDHVFERFTKRVGFEGEQYELNGIPLPYSSDKIFESLFPFPPAPPLPVTKPAFTVLRNTKRSYSAASLPACSSCRSRRLFECQLMPNLINVLENDDADGSKMTDEERLKAVELAFKGPVVNGPEAGRGMEWGTCMVFSCERDCCTDDNGVEVRECWREEMVLIQAAI